MVSNHLVKCLVAATICIFPFDYGDMGSISLVDQVQNGQGDVTLPIFTDGAYIKLPTLWHALQLHTNSMESNSMVVQKQPIETNCSNNLFPPMGLLKSPACTSLSTSFVSLGLRHHISYSFFMKYLPTFSNQNACKDIFQELIVHQVIDERLTPIFFLYKAVIPYIYD